MVRDYLPSSVCDVLFGDRKKYGRKPDVNDADWARWQKIYLEFYATTQNRGVGKIVNEWGYRHVFENISLENKKVLEIGPGSLPHRSFWKGTPSRYTLVDVDPRFLEIAAKKISCPVETHVVQRIDEKLPFAPETFDLVVSFYSLEHLLDLSEQLRAYRAVLKTGGTLAGAIPNEGGLAWGLGRALTSRRWMKKNSEINYDKIVCWEHPNFCDEIRNALSEEFGEVVTQSHPLRLLRVDDFNLVTTFFATKPSSN